LCGLVINYCHEVTDFAERVNYCHEVTDFAERVWRMNYNLKRMKRNFFDFLVLLIFLVFLIRRMFVYKKTTRWDLCGLVINYCHEVTDFAERGD